MSGTEGRRWTLAATTDTEHEGSGHDRAGIWQFHVKTASARETEGSQGGSSAGDVKV